MGLRELTEKANKPLFEEKASGKGWTAEVSGGIVKVSLKCRIALKDRVNYSLTQVFKGYNALKVLASADEVKNITGEKGKEKVWNKEPGTVVVEGFLDYNGLYDMGVLGVLLFILEPDESSEFFSELVSMFKKDFGKAVINYSKIADDFTR